MRRTVLQTIAIVLLAGRAFPLHAQETSLAVKLQSAIVSKVPQFVRWPTGSLDGRTSFEVCVVSTDPFAAPLQTLVAGDAIDGRPVTIRVLEREQDVDSCHVLFLSARAINTWPGLMQKVEARPILTVSDDERFFDKGGIVRLRVVAGRMRFDVNLPPAQRAGLQISSQFLQLAALVRGTQP